MSLVGNVWKKKLIKSWNTFCRNNHKYNSCDTMYDYGKYLLYMANCKIFQKFKIQKIEREKLQFTLEENRNTTQ